MNETNNKTAPGCDEPEALEELRNILRADFSCMEKVEFVMPRDVAECQ